MYLEMILKSLEAEGPRPYKANFSVREEDAGWWLEDDGRPLSLGDI